MNELGSRKGRERHKGVGRVCPQRAAGCANASAARWDRRALPTLAFLCASRVSATELRQKVAHGVSRGSRALNDVSRSAATESLFAHRGFCRPSGALAVCSPSPTAHAVGYYLPPLRSSRSSSGASQLPASRKEMVNLMPTHYRTLSPSPQPSPAGRGSHAHRFPPTGTLQRFERWLTFPLSQRERAGVRESGHEVQTGYRKLRRALVIPGAGKRNISSQPNHPIVQPAATEN